MLSYAFLFVWHHVDQMLVHREGLSTVTEWLGAHGHVSSLLQLLLPWLPLPRYCCSSVAAPSSRPSCLSSCQILCVEVREVGLSGGDPSAFTMPDSHRWVPWSWATTGQQCCTLEYFCGGRFGGSQMLITAMCLEVREDSTRS